MSDPNPYQPPEPTEPPAPEPRKRKGLLEFNAFERVVGYASWGFIAVMLVIYSIRYLLSVISSWGL
ncbi:hypothetical protein FYK55_03485 [Roseiconus nitratireducens]|uniref:Uncharacterized protein n=1 Tax=Roseiconus nitratireducens TaxID=2605748 RepID=A0A5M6DEP2_9BACT|nr:hypothetical protein [Roseiconus nitratireducens]KAA5545987.1 hypothetical protein FYK55_03485 [Roseiconus nitratireducens]